MDLTVSGAPVGGVASPSPRMLIFHHEVPLNSMSGTIFLAACVGGVLGAACAIVWGTVLMLPSSPLIMGTIQSVAMIPVMMLASWLPFRPTRVPRALDGVDAGNLRERLESLVLTFGGGAVRHYLNQLAHELARRGHTGLVILICPAARATIGEPLTVAFEPTELRGCEERLSGDEQGDLRSRLDQARAKQRRVLFIVLGIVGVALLMLGVLMGGSRLLKVLLEGLYVGVLIGLLSLALIGFGLGSARTQWLLVPGALARLRAKLWQRTWTPHLFRATQSTIVIARTMGDECLVCISDGHQRGETMVRLDDVRFAIRALQSKVEPPRVEWLGGLG